MSQPDRTLWRDILDHGADIFRICLGFTRNVTEAEDLCQEALLKALSCSGDLRERGGLRIWLLRIARSTCLDHHRRLKRLPVIPVDSVGEVAEADKRTPQALAESADDLRRLKRAVLGLPRRLREVLVLREYGELSYEDLARTLKLRPGTVMSRLNRARKAVGAAMGESHE